MDYYVTKLLHEHNPPRTYDYQIHTHGSRICLPVNDNIGCRFKYSL